MGSNLILASVFGGWGVVELGILLMVGLLIFGKRLPEVGRGLGKSIMEFKKGMSEVSSSVTAEAPIQPPVTAVITSATAAQLPAANQNSVVEAYEDRITKLTAELQSLQQEVAKHRQSQSA